MPRDTTQLLEATPDLTRPTLEGLAWLLRHKEAWPEGFSWYFPDCSRCAMGLASRIWPWPDEHVLDLLGTGGSTFPFSQGAYPCDDRDVRPEMVADLLERAHRK